MPANMCIETKGMNPKFNRKYTKARKNQAKRKGKEKLYQPLYRNQKPLKINYIQSLNIRVSFCPRPRTNILKDSLVPLPPNYPKHAK